MATVTGTVRDDSVSTTQTVEQNKSAVYTETAFANKINFGSSLIKNIYIGNNNVVAIYLGDELIYGEK